MHLTRVIFIAPFVKTFQALEGAHGLADGYVVDVRTGVTVPLLQDARLRREQQTRRMRTRQISHSLAR